MLDEGFNDDDISCVCVVSRKYDRSRFHVC